MTRDCLPFLEVKTIGDCAVVCVAFFDVPMTGGKVGCEEAEGSVMEVEPDADSTLVARNSAQASLKVRA